jgi:hypothetical protein
MAMAWSPSAQMAVSSICSYLRIATHQAGHVAQNCSASASNHRLATFRARIKPSSNNDVARAYSPCIAHDPQKGKHQLTWPGRQPTQDVMP